MKNYIIKVLLTIIACTVLLLLTSSVKADITITSDSKSTFTIVIPKEAPSSVNDAAKELQKCIELATGANLQLKKDGQEISGSMISLGSTMQAASAGVTTNEMEDGAYRILTKDNNVYILGIDTLDGNRTKSGGVSTGTATGVYTFLEEYLDVRWLMPGDIGRDVPRKSTFILEDINRTETPPFNYSFLSGMSTWVNHSQLQAGKIDWEARNRVGTNVTPSRPAHGHNWWKTINKGFGGEATNDVNTDAVKQAYKQHPDWFAMDENGKRPFPKNHYAKLDTTNPELVKWFAEQAITELKNSENPKSFSLSPSDGSGPWSQSPESKALFDPPASDVYDSEAASGKPGTSSLIMKWYHDIAQIVAKEYPEGRLGGYIYASYLYPPTKVDMTLPDNFTPTIAFSPSYGYGLYRPETQKIFKDVMASWAKVAPKDWYYYDLPNDMLRHYKAEIGDGNFPGTTGIITPPAAQNLNLIASTLRKSHIKGAYLYAGASWSNVAVGNYLLARLMWNPELGLVKERNLWLRRAYGEDTGKAMETFYDKLNDWFRDDYIKRKDRDSQLTRRKFNDIYAVHYAEMEKLFLDAAKQERTDIQQERFQLLEDNMIVLQWRLRNADMLDKDFKSPLQRSSEEVIDIMTRDNEAFPLFPGAVGVEKVNHRSPKPFKWDVKFSSSSSADKSTFKEMKGDTFLLYAAADGDIRIEPKMVKQDMYFASYNIKNQQGEIIESSILNTGTPITIPAKKGEAYYLKIPIRKPVDYKLAVQNAKVAEGNYDGKTLTLSGKDAPAYVYAAPSDSPIGIMEEDDSVVIRKPFSGAAALASYNKSSSYTDPKVVKSFDEGWRFSPDPKDDGVKRGVTEADYDDSDWSTVNALNWWQFQGFPDYHGPAWYRMKFDLDELPPKKRSVRLYFGAVDGDAEVYLNGKKITEHKLGPEPDFKGWDKAFTTYVRHDIKQGENILAVKVTNKPVGSAGITKGVSLLSLERVKK